MGRFLLLLVLVSLVNFSFSWSDKKPLKMVQFSWNDCTPKMEGSNKPGGEVKSISVGPDPVLIPGNLSLGFEVLANVNLTSPSPLSIRIQKKVAFFWVDVPCQNGVGSCDYEDFCAKWPIPGPSCPDSYKENKIPCNCPFMAGTNYLLPAGSNVGKIEVGSIPKWLENGEYRIKAWILSDKTQQQMLCVNLDLNLKAV